VFESLEDWNTWWIRWITIQYKYFGKNQLHHWAMANHWSSWPIVSCPPAKCVLCWNTKCCQMLCQSPVGLPEPCQWVSTIVWSKKVKFKLETRAHPLSLLDLWIVLLRQNFSFLFILEDGAQQHWNIVMY